MGVIIGEFSKGGGESRLCVCTFRVRLGAHGGEEERAVAEWGAGREGTKGWRLEVGCGGEVTGRVFVRYGYDSARAAR